MRQQGRAIPLLAPNTNPGGSPSWLTGRLSRYAPVGEGLAPAATMQSVALGVLMLSIIAVQSMHLVSGRQGGHMY